MSIDKASPTADSDDDDAWFRYGSVPPSRDDRIAEAIALVALLFSLGIGLAIAMLPVSAKAAEAVAPSRERPAFEAVPGAVVLSATAQRPRARDARAR
ncbi:hypothetical protein [Scleromatobacter humisilvae]|uniref:Uncharacterized protein n=1 Tax=Scleromatobacter humisilvae TaxID=2897159 RepID=A0A9X2BZF3_9BURK|nr:hypothetical protein [Scleromatobacter humisilvae]MCK9686267.1 hypothetical protein [Scleromatobacter humisilvae]